MTVRYTVTLTVSHQLANIQRYDFSIANYFNPKPFELQYS